ncbi:hypothetical protein [Sphaerotilus sp.]|jgi:hypothetical protein|uniref:hypothetical protein n=1 Tax=Sphaerotilus sp. TaxID=2093942 RepID=UPI00286E2876|nr:hypothetical protein [Sphaerotilus sp.]
MNDSSAPHRPRPVGWHPLFSRLMVLLAVVAGVPDVSAQGVQLTRNPANEATSSRQRAAPTVVRVISTRSHMQCPLPGKNMRLLSIDSPREWEDTIEHQDELTALGRKVRWAKERVLVYALESKPYAGVRLDSPSRVIRLSQGILYWPVRQVMPEMGAEKATVLTRPCVMTTIDRAYWQRIKIVPTRP